MELKFVVLFFFFVLFFFQAEDGIRDLVRSRGLGDVYKRQADWPLWIEPLDEENWPHRELRLGFDTQARLLETVVLICLLYTSELPTSDLV